MRLSTPIAPGHTSADEHPLIGTSRYSGCKTRYVSNEPPVHARRSCPVCTNGELVLSILTADKRLIVECMECLSGYTEPTDLATSRVVRMEETESRFATAHEVETAGMIDLLEPSSDEH